MDFSSLPTSHPLPPQMYKDLRTNLWSVKRFKVYSTSTFRNSAGMASAANHICTVRSSRCFETQDVAKFLLPQIIFSFSFLWHLFTDSFFSDRYQWTSCLWVTRQFLDLSNCKVYDDHRGLKMFNTTKYSKQNKSFDLKWHLPWLKIVWEHFGDWIFHWYSCSLRLQCAKEGENTVKSSRFGHEVK